MWIKSRVFLFCALTVASFSHAAQDDAKPPAWQVEGFLAALNDENPNVLLVAFNSNGSDKLINILGERAKDQLPRFVKMLSSQQVMSRQVGAIGLGKFGIAAKDQVPHLIELLKDSNDDVKLAAAEGLENMGIAVIEQAPRLIELLNESDDITYEIIADLLIKLRAATNDKAFRLDEIITKPCNSSSGINTNAIILKLADWPNVAKQHLPQLIEILRSSKSYYYCQEAAATVLGNLKSEAKEWIPRIVELSTDPNPITRKALILTLHGLDTEAKNQIPLLIRFLHDPDLSVRDQANKTLIKQILVAKDYMPHLTILLRDPDPGVRTAAIHILGALATDAKDEIPRMVALLRDPDSAVRRTTAETLGKIGKIDKNQASRLEKILEKHLYSDPSLVVRSTIQIALNSIKNPQSNSYFLAPPVGLDIIDTELQNTLTKGNLAEILRTGPVQSNTIRNLMQNAPISMSKILEILIIGYEDISRVGELRFLSHFLGGGVPDIETLIAWIGEPITRPTTAVAQNHDLAIKTLHVFEQAWPLSEPFPKLRRDLEAQIATVVQTGRWKPDDLPLLKTHATNLEAIGSTHAAAVRQVIASVEATDYVLAIAKVALGHVLFWLALIAIYPRSRIVQAIFFWNPWVRRFTGLGYVGFALTWVPFLRTTRERISPTRW